MWKLLGKLMYLFGLLAMAGLLGAYAASYIDPNVSVLPALLGVSYPYLLIANLVFLLYWVLRWKKMAWFELAVILLGIPAFMTYYGTAEVREADEPADLAILSYNVRYFDFYNWSEDKNARKKLLDYLNGYKGDVICLQEFSMKFGSADEKALANRLNTYPYRYISDNMGIFSRLPIVGQGRLAFPKDDSGSCLYCDLVVGNDTVRVYNVHLESYRFSTKDRAFVQGIGKGIKDGELSDGARGLAARFAVATRNRAKQAEQISRHLCRSPYFVILCGDFNDTPLSYTYRKMKTGLRDAFIECGRGVGNTYIGEFPSFRIDYILHSPELSAVSYFRDTVALSDHYPVRCRFRME